MLTLNAAVLYLRQHYPDDFEIVGPGDVEHLLSGGEYGTTKDAQFSDTWAVLTNVATVIALLQFSHTCIAAGIGKGKQWREARQQKAEELKRSNDAIARLRTDVIAALAKKHGIEVDPEDPILSDEAIKRALSSVAEDESDA